MKHTEECERWASRQDPMGGCICNAGKRKKLSLRERAKEKDLERRAKAAFKEAEETGRSVVCDENGKPRFVITIPQDDLDLSDRKLAIPELRVQERVAPPPREDDPEISEEDWKLLEAAFSTPLDHE